MILFSGEVKIDLKRIPKPYGRPKEIKEWPLSKETNSLFEKTRVRGWWPVAGKPKKKDKKKNKIAKSVERVLTVGFNLSIHHFIRPERLFLREIIPLSGWLNSQYSNMKHSQLKKQFSMFMSQKSLHLCYLTT